MSTISRRSVLTGAASALGVAAVTVAAPDPSVAATPSVSPGATAAADAASGQGCAGAAAATVVTPADPRYQEMVTGINTRFVGSPRSVQLVVSTDQVLRAVQAAVTAAQRVSVRSGGHCYADFVYRPGVDVVIDLSQMSQVCYDPARRAFMVEAGAQLGRLYEELYRGWGVTIPGGACPTVGIGGHATGGGFGLLSRSLGIVADYLDAVEMVVVDASGRARVVVAGREGGDPHADLCWAVAGGGGGSFGIVTRYWFRSPGATGTDPARQLPAPPEQVLFSGGLVPYTTLDQTSFSTLLRNFGTWHEQNSAPSSPCTALSGVLLVHHRSGGGIAVLTQVDATAPDAAQLLSSYYAALFAGTGLSALPARPMSWLASTKAIAASAPTLSGDPTQRSAVKSAFLRTALNDTQLASAWQSVTRSDYSNAAATLQLSGAGGRINQVAATGTAYSHRTATSVLLQEAFWLNPADDALHLGWMRDTYRGLFPTTGGYPVPGSAADGCYINDPDPDITNPAYNTSGVPWSTLYWGANYARLQQVKAAYDPTDFFRHAQSVRLP
jgi:hypothetical protein